MENLNSLQLCNKTHLRLLWIVDNVLFDTSHPICYLSFVQAEFASPPALISTGEGTIVTGIMVT